MEVKIELEQARIVVSFSVSKEERESIYGEKMAESLDFSIASSGQIDLRLAHNDHLALIVLLAAHPFAQGRLSIPLHVSKQFEEATQIFSRYRPEFLSTAGKPYTSKSEGKPGLAFSGGMDSTAALALMPSKTVPVFLDRPHRANTTLYNKSAAKATLAFLEAKGVPNIAITTDVEFIRNPVGFPTDLATGIPVLALASHFQFDSVGYGTVMESAYRIGHKKSRDYIKAPHYKVWAPLFAAAGLPLFLPVAGVSEVGTSTIVHRSPYRGMARSCIRGDWPQTCNNCWKCFRKQLIEHGINQTEFDDNQFLESLQSKEVVSKLSAEFISHENVLGWALNKIERGKKLDVLFNRLVASTYSLNHLNTFYPPAIALVPPKYRLHVNEQLRIYLPEMEEVDQKRMLEQDFSDYLSTPQHKENVQALMVLLNG
tara:strand:- start:703 stop:1986 length:1284 start_codon:yes stop_codon:yes gene_type:complete